MNVPRWTPCSRRACKIVSVGTVSLPVTSKSQMKSELTSSSAAHRMPPANSAWRRRRRAKKKGVPAVRSIDTSAPQPSAARRSARRSPRATQKDSAVSSIHLTSQNSMPRAEQRFSIRSGYALFARTHTLPRSSLTAFFSIAPSSHIFHGVDLAEDAHLAVGHAAQRQILPAHAQDERARPHVDLLCSVG